MNITDFVTENWPLVLAVFFSHFIVLFAGLILVGLYFVFTGRKPHPTGKKKSSTFAAFISLFLASFFPTAIVLVPAILVQLINYIHANDEYYSS